MSVDLVEDKREKMRKLLNSFSGNNINSPEKVEELNREIFKIQKEIYES